MGYTCGHRGERGFGVPGIFPALDPAGRLEQLRKPFLHRRMRSADRPGALDGYIMNRKGRPELLQARKLGVQLPQEEKSARVPVVKVQHRPRAARKEVPPDGGTEERILRRVLREGVFRRIVAVDGIPPYARMFEH